MLRGRMWERSYIMFLWGIKQKLDKDWCSSRCVQVQKGETLMLVHRIRTNNRALYCYTRKIWVVHTVSQKTSLVWQTSSKNTLIHAGLSIPRPVQRHINDQMWKRILNFHWVYNGAKMWDINLFVPLPVFGVQCAQNAKWTQLTTHLTLNQKHDITKLSDHVPRHIDVTT